MNTQPLYRYLALAALMGFWSCASTQQTARNTGEVDDLYANSASAQVYANNSSDVSPVAERPSRQQQRFERQQSARNRNPEYTDEQPDYDANSDEYYSELSARKLNRGLSPDPGWNDDGTNAYNSGFVNGFNSAQTSALSWNRWGFNNTGFFNGFNLGLGLGSFGGWGSPWGFNRLGWGGGFYDPFYSPFGFGGAYAYNSPFGYGGFYDPFYSPYAYGGFYNSFYSPFYGGGFGRPVIVNNVVVTGADPYRSRTYGPRFNRSSGRYNDAFVNTPRTTTDGGGRRAAGSNPYASGRNTGNATANTYSNRGSNSGYYAAPRQNSRGTYYYDNGTGTTGRSGATTGRAYSTPAPSYNSGNSGSEYYAAPRQNSRGSYTPSNGGSRGSYSQPSYQQQSQSSYSAPQRSYSQPSTPSYSAPSYSGGSRGGSSSSGSSGGSSYSGGGGSRGPR